MDRDQNEATAYHEAGHAIMGLALGRPVREISILPDRIHLGWCEFHKPGFRPTEDWLEREILIALGGIAAEIRHFGDFDLHGSTRDRQYVRRLSVQRAGERKAERLERRLLAKAVHILGRESHWRAVERVVHELLQRGEISGRSARHLFDREMEHD